MPRSPSATAHRKVLDAALAIIAERGVEATSMDAVAALSGVSKATIYKHWADKDALLLEVMCDLHGLRARPKFDSGDTKSDILAVLAYRPLENVETRERVMPHFIAYGSRNAAFGQAWRNLVMDPPRRELRRLLKSGVRNGELTRKLDVELSLALLLGPLMYWHIFLRKTLPNAPDDPGKLAAGVVDAFWRAFAVRGS
jgi:AcrR family transcriptional regulator